MRETDFEALYTADADPFGVASTWYERRKQASLLAAFAQDRYTLAWDVACGTGHLAEALAGRSQQVIASDSSPRAVEITAAQVRSQPRVECVTNRLPQIVAGAERCDLVVVAEVLYYLPQPDRNALIGSISAWDDAEIAMVHWRHKAHDAYLSGADVHAEAGGALEGAGRDRLVRHVDRDFVLDTWSPR